MPVNEIVQSSTSGAEKSNQSSEEQKKEIELHKYLINVRNEMASQIGLSAQKVCNSTQLSALAKMRPSTKQNLAFIEGFPYEKIETIGAQLVDKIVFFCNKFKIEMDNFNTKESDKTMTNTNINELIVNFRIVNSMNFE